MPYLFGDSDLALRRHRLLAEVFEPPSRWFLEEHGPRNPRVAVDLGCAEGFTTRLVAEVLEPGRTVGLDVSESYVEAARNYGGDEIEYHLHDIKAAPFPVVGANLVYCRLGLIHLEKPQEAIATWATQMAKGGLLMIEEVDAIQTSNPVLGRYLEILDAVLASQQNTLYIGPTLDGMEDPPLLPRRLSRGFTYDVAPSRAAAIFSMSIRTWGHSSVVQSAYGPAIESLELDLDRLAIDANPSGDITWTIRQMVFERTE